MLGKVFPSRELHVRNVLLEQFTYYADLFNEEKLKKVILPQVGLSGNLMKLRGKYMLRGFTICKLRFLIIIIVRSVSLYLLQIW